MPAAPLLRPSALARFWALHPKTVTDWIRSGELVAIRTPGAQYRIRANDVRDFCVRRALPVPPFARTDVMRIVIAGGTAATQRAIARALEGELVELESFTAALDGIVAAVRDPPAIVAIDASSREVDVEAAIHALRQARGLERVIAIAYEKRKIGALVKRLASLLA